MVTWVDYNALTLPFRARVSQREKESIAKEIGSRNIRTNAIAPGFIQTDMTDVLDDKVKEELMKNIPLRRLGNGEEVANAVLFLASDMSSYVNGQTISVCGGMSM